MRLVKTRGTGPERVIKSLLRRAGIRFRTNIRRAGVRTDFLLNDHRVALLVDGCFWHGCFKHRPLPKSHVSYWSEKVRRNRLRDRRNSRDLRLAGWTVVRIWEHTVVRRRERVITIVRHAIARAT